MDLLSQLIIQVVQVEEQVPAGYTQVMGSCKLSREKSFSRDVPLRDCTGSFTVLP